MSVDSALLSILRPLLSQITRRVLRPELGSQAADSVWTEANREYRSVSKIVSREKTIGARVMVRLAAFTVALFRTLKARNIPADRAQELTREITWRTYRRLAWLPWKATRVVSDDPRVRAKTAMDLFMRFPYSKPGYEMEYVDAGDEVVAFDVYRCPVAEHFAREGLSGLCTASFCDLDFSLAAEWGLDLHRPLTISRGNDHCDFRFCLPAQSTRGKTQAAQQGAAADGATRRS